MQVWLEIYLEQVLGIVLPWCGGAARDIHAKVPCHPFSFPCTGCLCIDKWNILTMDYCVRGTLPSPPHARWHNKEVDVFVWLTLHNNMRKLVVPSGHFIPIQEEGEGELCIVPKERCLNP